MTGNSVAPSARASRPESKTQDDKEFRARWIAFGMALKGKADGFGIEWREVSFEKWMAEIGFAEVWAEANEGVENHA